VRWWGRASHGLKLAKDHRITCLHPSPLPLLPAPHSQGNRSRKLEPRAPSRNLGCRVDSKEGTVHGAESSPKSGAITSRELTGSSPLDSISYKQKLH